MVPKEKEIMNKKRKRTIFGLGILLLTLAGIYCVILLQNKEQSSDLLVEEGDSVKLLQ